MAAGSVYALRFSKLAGESFNISVTFNTSTPTVSSLTTYIGDCSTGIIFTGDATVSGSTAYINTYRGSGGSIDPFYMTATGGYLRISAPSATAVRATITFHNVGSSICSSDSSLVPSMCSGRFSWSLPTGTSYSRSTAEANLNALIDNWNVTNPGGYTTSSQCYSRFLDQACRQYAPACTVDGRASGNGICAEDCVAHTEIACGSTSLALKLCSTLSHCTSRLPVAPFSLPAPPSLPPSATPKAAPVAVPVAIPQAAPVAAGSPAAAPVVAPVAAPVAPGSPVAPPVAAVPVAVGSPVSAPSDSAPTDSPVGGAPQAVGVPQAVGAPMDFATPASIAPSSQAPSGSTAPQVSVAPANGTGAPSATGPVIAASATKMEWSLVVLPLVLLAFFF